MSEKVYTRAELEGFVAGDTAEGRKKLVSILRDELGWKIAEVVKLTQASQRIDAILAAQKEKGGKAAAPKKGAVPSSKPAATVGRPKKAVEPEPEEEEVEETPAPESGSDFSAALEALAEINQKLDAILEEAVATKAEAAAASLLARHACICAGAEESDLDELLGN